MIKVAVSPEWSLNEVVKRLEESIEPGRSVSAQVFVADSVPVEGVAAAARKIVTDATRRLKLSSNAVRVGKIRGLAKSFSVTSDKAAIFAEIAKQRDVKTVLESEQSDILPHSGKRTAVL